MIDDCVTVRVALSFFDGVEPDAGALVDGGVAADGAGGDETLPEPSVSTPPPASPAWLLLIVLLLSVSVQGVLTVFSIDTPPPSAVAELLVTIMLFSVRLWLPWSRMPPPLATAPSGLLRWRRRPGRSVMVKPLHGHGEVRGGVVGVAGVDVEDAVEAAAIDRDRAAAGVLDGQVAFGQDGEFAGQVVGLVGSRRRQGDAVGAGDVQVDGVAARGFVGGLDGRTQSHGIRAVDLPIGRINARREAQIGQAVHGVDRQQATVFERFDSEADAARTAC